MSSTFVVVLSSATAYDLRVDDMEILEWRFLGVRNFWNDENVG